MKRIETFLGLNYTMTPRSTTLGRGLHYTFVPQERNYAKPLGSKFLTHILSTPPPHLITSAGQLSASSQETQANT